MNDRYLYRAKRCDNGEWVSGSYVYAFSPDKECPVVGVHKENHWIVEENGSMVAVDPSTICQCTGLKDKNGKLIWEHDIVWDSEERKVYKIIFSQEDMCYYAQDSDGYKDTFESCYGSSIDVESNIFDNPELLEVGE